MSCALAIVVALLTGSSQSPDSTAIRPTAFQTGFCKTSLGFGLETRALAWFSDSSRTIPPDHRTSVAMLLAPREDAEETRETEEEDSEEENAGRTLASAGQSGTPWNGPAAHLRCALEPSYRLSTRALFLLCGRLTC